MKIFWLMNEKDQDYIKGLLKSNDHKVITCKSDYDKTEQDNFKDIDALVVQINLGWYVGDGFDGIRLVQELRLFDSVSIPIVFLSLSESRGKILYDHPNLDIISTFGLGNGFCFKKGESLDFSLPMDIDETPTSMEDYIKLLPEIDAVRRFDIKHFCRKEDQIRRLKHEAPYLKFEQVKEKLMKLSENDPRVCKVNTKEEFYKLCDTLINELEDNNKSQTNSKKKISQKYCF